MRKKVFFSSGVVALISLMTFSVSPSEVKADESKRLMGDTRTGTAIELSKEGWASSDSVILARSDSPADALASAGLTSSTDSPTLLTGTEDLDSEVLNEIERLGAENVYILGGSAAISDSVENELSERGLNVVRASGDTRYGTAKDINEKAGLNTSSTAIVVNGRTVADALSASSIAANKDIPVYLTKENGMPENLPSSVEHVVMFGGSAAIDTSVEDTLESQGKSVERISGDDRYETSIKAAEWAGLSGEVNLLARGTSTKSDQEDYPDAVAAGGLGNRLNAPVVLTHPDKAVSAVENFLSSRPSYVLGGEGAIADNVLTDLGINISAEGEPEEASESDSSPEEEAVRTAEIDALDKLNVRTGPSVDEEKIGSLSDGEEVDIYETADNGWVRIKYGETMGYVSGSYLENVEGVSDTEEEPVNDAPPEEEIERTAEVGSVDNLNVRTGPSVDEEKIGSVSGGEEVDIYETADNGWARIKYGETTGYVSGLYLEDIQKITSVTDKVIAVDPGHGDQDPGAVANGIEEKDVALSVALNLEEELEDAGAEVVMTRSDDTFVELDERSDLANEKEADSFVSVHANASVTEEAAGQETFFYSASEEGEELAESIQEELVEVIDSSDRGTRGANFAVLRETAMPATLVELGFLTNEEESEILGTSEFQQEAGTAISEGIENYYEEK